MKTFFKILGFLIVIVIVAMIIIPLIFHNQIIEKVKEEANANIEARLDFEDYNLSLFRNFPNFGLELEEVSVMGIDEFSGVKLAEMPSFNLSIDLFSVFSGGPYEIEKIQIEEPYFHVKILEDGKANYDIAKETNEAVETDKADSDVHLKLRSVQITNGTIIYEDHSTTTFVQAEGVNHKLSGDFTADLTDLKTNTLIRSMDVNYDGVDYLHNNEVAFDADIEANLKNDIYKFEDNELRINALKLNFDGSVGIVDEGYDLVLNFETPENTFKSFLSLIPAIYSKDFGSIETEGELEMDGSIKGRYSETQMPTFEINIDVSDAMFKYPELPDKVTDIGIFASISNTTGKPDNTVIDVRMLHFVIAGNPVDVVLNLKNPVSDPRINADISGKLDLASIKRIYPMEGDMEMSGMITSDISLNGKLSDLEEENYEDFAAIGSILVKDMVYKSPDIKKDLSVKRAQLNFSPAYLDLVNLNAIVGKSQMQANGRIKQYLPYIMSDGVISGELKFSSSYLDMNDFIPEGGDEPEPLETDTMEFKAFRVPADVDFRLQTTVDEFVFDSLRMKNVEGELRVAGEKISLNSISADMFGGRAEVFGSYSTYNTDYPDVSFNLDIDTFGIVKSFDGMALLQTYAPFAERINGSYSGSLSFGAKLDDEFIPVISTINGKGNLKTSPLVLDNFALFNKLGDTLGVDALTKEVEVGELDLYFRIKEGALTLAPIEMSFAGIESSLEGTTGPDLGIDYDLAMNVPKDVFGSDVNDYLNNLVEQTGVQLGNVLKMNVNITGSLTNPQFKLGFGDLVEDTGETIKKQVEEKIEEKKEEVIGKTKEEAQKILDEADKKAQEVLDEAQAKADKIRKEARAAAQEVRDQADENATKMIEKAKEKGPLAEMASKKAAEKLKKEANQKAGNMVKEVDRQAENIMKEAQNKAEQIRSEAQKKVDG